MVHRLSRFFFLVICFLSLVDAQESDCQKYQDRQKFSKKAKLLAAWQIRQLKNGALIVRIPDEQSKIKKLIISGNAKEAALRYEKFRRKYLLQYRLFKKYFTFCKVYFMYAKDYRRILKGERNGFFLDSSLCINDTLTLRENFFMIAEEDDVYASTIGFVKESCAMQVHETGHPAIHANWVLKNKYGHQVKEPFPMYVSSRFAKNLNYAEMHQNYIIKLCDTTVSYSKIYVEIKDAEYREDIQQNLIIELNDRLEGFLYKSTLNEKDLVLIKDYLY
ncbi:MAG: hypothetical protein N3F09_06350 [Bacteroidia bacterium]|nr:hypothetical protein [Bacteroidia bacterium]